MRLNQVALLGGTFLLTLALLLSGWMLVSGTPAPTPTVSPAPTTTSPSASPTGPGPTASPTTTGPAATRTPFQLQTFAPLRTPRPTDVPRSSAEPGETVTYTIEGRDYAESVVPDEARLSRNGGSVTLDTTSSTGEPLWVTWRLAPERLPANAVIVSVDVRICGYGDGDFWEVYGPDGGTPFEYEVLASGADGCWDFADAPGHDLSVVAGVMLRSRMTVHYVEYAITFGL